jgi:hypothetical protein
MSGRAPFFWQQPIRYWRWSSRERPALFWSCVIGALGPVTLAVVPPIRHALGDYDAKPIPTTYPSMAAHPPTRPGSTLPFSPKRSMLLLLFLVRADVVNSPHRPQEGSAWL